MARHGAERRYPRLAPLVAAVAGVMLVTPSGPLSADQATQVLVMADAIPVPRLDPRQRTSDPIGALIAGNGEPDAAAPPATPDAAPAEETDLASVGFTVAAELLRKGDPAGATIAAYALPDRVSADLIDWLVATSGDENVPSSRIMEIMAKLDTWPGTSLMQLRLEQALIREEADGPAMVAALAERKVELHEASLALASGLKRAGRTSAATKIIRDIWRNETPAEDIEKKLLAAFGSDLTASDHKARMDRLLYDGLVDAALRTAKQLSGTQRKLAAAVAATIRRQSKAKSLLNGLPRAAATDPLAIYSKVQLARRSGRDAEAARLLEGAPTGQDVLVDPDAWWVERRIVSRALAEEGSSRRAYDVAANHSAKSSTRRAEAEFHAGWYALEYLGEPATAKKHFAKITEIASRPLSLSRAYYWLGRAAKAAGDTAGAEEHFRRAGGYRTTYHGQLALSEIGVQTLQLNRAETPSASDRDRFDGRRFVQVIRRLLQANHADRSGVFFRRLARELKDTGEVKLLSDLAQSVGLHQTALQVGIIASSRGLAVDDLAFRTEAIPSGAKTGDVEKEVVYAIARQESKFNQEAISRAGARGLLQLMPATAKETARALGLRYSRDRLTSDPAFNATLGASFLGQMMDRFGGSYVMTFAAYNAGGSRVDEWIKRFGDPRDPGVDIVNWIESIPFTETRNYVQRVMENLQVYRARFGDTTLSITADLRRPGTG